MKEFHTYTLPNGIRGIHRQVRGNVAHCALVVGADTPSSRVPSGDAPTRSTAGWKTSAAN